MSICLVDMQQIYSKETTVSNFLSLLSKSFYSVINDFDGKHISNCKLEKVVSLLIITLSMNHDGIRWADIYLRWDLVLFLVGLILLE